MQRIIRLAALASLVLATATGPVYAASGSDGSGTSKKSQALIQKYQKQSQKLEEIHEKTIKNNPELKKEQKQYRDMVQSAIKNEGYDVESGRAELQSLSKDLQSGDMSKDKREQAMQKFQSERKKMTKARRQAMNKPAIKKAQKKLQSHTMAAMKKQNSKTDNLVKSLREIQKKMRNSMQKQQPQSG